jgi:predicted porin
MRRGILIFALSTTAFAPSGVCADATIYGKVDVSIDYLDVNENAAWGRPIAAGTPSFDALSFINDANQALNEAGYRAALPPPRELDTVVGDLLFDTIPFESLDNETRRRIFGAIEDARTRGRAFRGWDLNANDRGNRLGIRGSEDLGGGLKAIYQVELGIPVTDRDGEVANGDPNGIGFRNSFVGLAGSWGTLLVGRHDTPTKLSTARLDLFADTLADYNHTVGFSDIRADNTVLYLSPMIWGLQAAGALIPAGGATAFGGADPKADSIAAGWSLAVNFRRGPFYASAAYEVLSSELWAGQDGSYDMIHGVFADDETKWRIGLGLLDWHGFTLAGVYESRQNVLGMSVDASADLWQIQTGYAFGNNLIKAMVGAADLGGCADPWDIGYRYTCSAGTLGGAFTDPLQGLLDQQDKRTWALGFDHSFSRRTKIYTLYTAVDDDIQAADWSGFSLGLLHRF